MQPLRRATALNAMPPSVVPLLPTPPLPTLGLQDGNRGGEDAADADCGCSGGLSRELPAALGGSTGSSASQDGNAVTVEPVAAAAGDGGCGSETGPSESASEEIEGDMVYVEEGEFRFGTDKPFIIPVGLAVPCV